MIDYIWGSDLHKDIEKELQNHYEDRTLILRNFYDGDNLKYNPEGDLISGGEPGTWSLDGFVNLKKLKVKKDKIILEGIRLLWSYNQNIKTTVYYKSQYLNIEIGPYDSLPDVKSSRKTIQNIFLTKNEFSTLVPVYWKNFVKKVFEDGNAPDYVTPNNKQFVPYSTDSDVRTEHKEATVLKGRLIKKTNPTYPDLAKRLRVSGEVTFKVKVNKEGIPTVQDVISPIGLGMEESAIETISKWRFTPTYVNGEPTEVPATITVNFVLGR